MPWDDRIKRRLKLRDLDTLLAVAQWGSMAKAAAHLSMSQPAVSKAVADMEATLGVRLLDRTAQGVEPTLYGQALLESGITIFDDLRQGIEKIGFLTDPTAGELRIGTTEPMSAGLLPAVIDRLSRRYPRITFHVKQVPALPLQYDELRNRGVELIIGRMRELVAEEDLEADILFHEQLYVVAGLRNPWARRRKIDLADLVNEPWFMLPTNTVAGSLAADAFRASGLEGPRMSVVGISIQLQISLLATDRFLTMLPTSVLQFGANRLMLKALPVNLPHRPWPVAVVKLKNRTVSPVAQLFIECVHEVAKPLTKRK